MSDEDELPSKDIWLKSEGGFPARAVELIVPLVPTLAGRFGAPEEDLPE
jgi:hypothetical protein